MKKNLVKSLIFIFWFVAVFLEFTSSFQWLHRKSLIILPKRSLSSFRSRSFTSLYDKPQTGELILAEVDRISDDFHADPQVYFKVSLFIFLLIFFSCISLFSSL
jgi:hypothetical protein